MVEDTRQNRRAAAMQGADVQNHVPVFVYSGYRSSSTWFWNALRANDDCVAYYEPFNPQLAELTPANIPALKPGDWRSHHPGNASYWYEYAHLLQDEVGVPLFPVEHHPGEKYIGREGALGPLDDDVRAYVQNLIEAAQQLDRVPVLAGTRMLARAKGFREAFGGVHILLVRNLFHQWNSFAGQASFGNFFFLRTLYDMMRLADRDTFIAYLCKSFTDEERHDFDLWSGGHNFDKVFCFFAGLHVYLLTLTRRHADITVDVNALARNGSDYRSKLVADIHSLTGLKIDLADVRENVDYPLYPIQSRSDCERVVRSFADKAALLLEMSNDERGFSDRLLDEMWDEHARFSIYTRSVPELVERHRAYVSSTTTASFEAERNQLTDTLRDAEARLAEAHSALKAADLAHAEGREAWTSEQKHLSEQLAAERSSLLDLLRQAEERAALSAESLSAAERNVENLRADLALVAATQALAQERLDLLEHERQGALAKVDKQRLTIDALRQELTAALEVKVHVAVLEGELARAQAQREQAEAHAQTWKSALEEAHRQFRQIEINHEARLAAATKSVGDLLQQIEAQAEELRLAGNMRRQRDEELRQAWSSNERADGEIAELNAKISALQSGWDEDRSRLQSLLEDCQRQLAGNEEAHEAHRLAVLLNHERVRENVISALAEAGRGWLLLGRAARLNRIRKIVENLFALDDVTPEAEGKHAS